MTAPLPLPDDPRPETTAAYRETLEGGRVVAVEVVGAESECCYVVLRFESGATLYADTPTLYERKATPA